MKFVCILFSCVVVALGQNYNGGEQGWYCGILMNEDCMEHAEEPICGTNGVTYRNVYVYKDYKPHGLEDVLVCTLCLRHEDIRRLYFRCDLGQVHCENTDVNQLYEGSCQTATAGTIVPPEGTTDVPMTTETTTRSTEDAVHGSELILDFQCALLSHKECVSVMNEKICGTDGRTYADFCEYEKARCTHRDLHVAKTGDCAA